MRRSTVYLVSRHFLPERALPALQFRGERYHFFAKPLHSCDARSSGAEDIVGLKESPGLQRGELESILERIEFKATKVTSKLGLLYAVSQKT